MNPNKRILKIFGIGLIVLFLLNLLCDGINYLTWSADWTRQRDAGFSVAPGNAWWTWMN